MENHPIPQDVTGFKFKLIGSVTVKQFLYLLGGGIMAVLFVFVFPGTAFVRFPLAVLFASVGAALAFVPIDGRPMDKMIMSFLKALPQENMYMYHKHGVNLSMYEFFKPPAVVVAKAQSAPQTDIRRQILFTQFGGSALQPDPAEKAILDNVHALFSNTPQVQPMPQVAPVASVPKSPPSPQKIKVVLPKQETQKTAPAPTQLPEAQKPEPKIETGPSAAPLNPNATVTYNNEDQKTNPQQPVVVVLPQMPDAKQTLTRQADEEINKIQAQAAQRVTEAKNERELLEKRIKELEAEKQKKHTQKPTSDAGKVLPTEKVTILSQSQTQFKAGFPSLPDIPNVMLGIVKDPRGRVLPNILVEIVDSKNIPVRAFKTNQLGQFASATPLPAGTYKVYFEDTMKKHEFDAVEVTLNNQIFQPLEIVSVDEREKMRQDLFGK